jgi:DNA-3-methyladenine glycosylase
MSVFRDVLPASFYGRDPETVARELLGKRLVHDYQGSLTAGIIVETEAYLATNDPANHAYRGRTKRNASMFGPPGRAYVYKLHGHHCVNVVTEGEHVASAVLIRAVEPLTGIDVMHTRRCIADLTSLTNGPGKLCQAFAIVREALDGWDLTQGQCLWLAASEAARPLGAIAVSGRIGVPRAGELPLRFYVRSSPFLSHGPHIRFP